MVRLSSAALTAFWASVLGPTVVAAVAAPTSAGMERARESSMRPAGVSSAARMTSASDSVGGKEAAIVLCVLCRERERRGAAGRKSR